MSRKPLVLIGALAVTAVGAAMLVGRGGRPQDQPKPVVVEVFTAEGCSGCPPADEAIDELIRKPNVANAQMIVLAEHVSYWDHIGWVDPFAQEAFKTRQSDYLTHVFRNGGLYAPQAVVDGLWEGSGASAEAMRRAARDAAAAPKASMTVAPTWLEAARAIRVEMHVELPAEFVLKERADVVLAIAEDRLTSRITAGENNGKTLQHNALARLMKTVGMVEPHDRVWSTTTTVPVPGGWKWADLQAIGMLQERTSRRIIGAAAGRVVAGSRSSD